MEITLNVTLNNNFSEFKVPVEESMLLIDLIFAIEGLMKTMVDDITTFDLYDVNFQRIALVSQEELFIAPEYKDIYTVLDLESTTIEVIGLGKRSVSKVLQEERDLLVALDNYEI